MKGQILQSLAVITAVFITACTTAPPSQPGVTLNEAPALSSSSATGSASARNTQRAKSLGTAWGEEHYNPVSTTNFQRAKQATGRSSIFYQDKASLAQQKRQGFAYKGDKWQLVAGGLVEWGIKSRGRILRPQIINSKRVVGGRSGDAYSIVLRNKSHNQIEVVVSVDGLDVLDGKAASVKKRGYIIQPKSKLEIKGFRTSSSTIAEFRFSPVSASYSNLKYGKTQNVGIIGLAVYEHARYFAKPPRPFPGSYNKPVQSRNYAEGL